MVDSLQAVARLINESLVKRIVVLVGAGISVPSGIPDFRSPESGFYRQIQKEENISDPASVFDLKLFKRDPTLFYKVAWRLFPGNHKPNEVYPFAGIIDLVKHTTPRLLINKIAVGQFSENPRQNDYIYEGDVVKGILELCKLLHWTNDLTALMQPSDEVYAT
ncbi:transcriptional regulator, Sir2 family [Trichinella nativa]|uniref:Transcriptional regulator, Sir2 family n=1 Tax=Trichinella nativa TaxID=6335 RepID=A0A1Y3E917_9BILA|nr:transcriptional regulator, Sir2 family [Trichinella nativa]